MDATIGQPYHNKLSLIDAGSPIRDFSIISGQLPKGLELELVEKEWNRLFISGVPEEVGSFRFMIRVELYGTNFGFKTHRFLRSIKVESQTP